MNLSDKNSFQKEGVPKVNNHLHTPWSFSAFTSIEQIFQMAKNENLVSVAINDFFTADGYGDFNNLAQKYRIYPEFNIEFIGLISDFQERGIRVNDPNNPGRIYFSGKGLSIPFSLPEEETKTLISLQSESQRQVIEMIEKANSYFNQKGAGIHLEYSEIRRIYAKKLVRERHIAKAIYEAVVKKCKWDSDKVEKLFTLIYGTKPSSMPGDMAASENEVRSRLLKTGGAAFVPEDESAFLSLPRIINLIITAGGIPCYPTLLDDAKGSYTDFEKDWEKMYKYLKELNIGCIELIPNRNSIEQLEAFVKFFRERDFIITFGTEHNSPDMIPVTPCCRNNVLLSEWLNGVSFEGACVIAAHQELMSQGKPGFLDNNGTPGSAEIKEFSDFGRAVIEKFIKN